MRPILGGLVLGALLVSVALADRSPLAAIPLANPPVLRDSDQGPGHERSGRLTLEPDRDCYVDGDTATIEVWMHDVVETIVAGQFYLQYNDALLTLVSVEPGDAAGTDPANPFEMQVYECSVVEGGSEPQCSPVSGLIDYAVGIPGGASGVSGDAKLAVITFTVAGRICAETDLIVWRQHVPPSRLADNGENPVYPTLEPLGVVDDQAPVISGLAAAGGAADANCERTVTFGATVSDNGCLDPDSLVVDVALHAGQAVLGTPVVTKTPDGAGGYELSGSVLVSDVASCPATLRVTVFAVDECVNVAGTPGTDPIDGRWTESYPSYPSGDGSVVHAASWDGSNLGLEWVLDGPTRAAQPELLWDTHTGNPSGGGEMVWRTHYTGGTLWISGLGTAGVVRHTQVRHDVYVAGSIDENLSWADFITHALIPGAGTGLTLTGVAHLEGSGATPDPGYPEFEPGHTFGQWGRLESVQLHTVGMVTAEVTDATAPTVTAPPDTTVQCLADVPAGATSQAEFVAAGGSATDNCTADAELVVAFADGPLTGGECGGTITRTYTITDRCDNQSVVVQTITVDDTLAPSATAPPDAAVECVQDVPAPAATYAEFVVAGGSAADNCTAGDDLVISSADGPLNGGPCGGTITRTYTITDECQNAVAVQQTFTVRDTIDPTATAPPDMSVECVADIPAAATNYAEFAAAGGTASDNCTPSAELVITHADSPLSGPCPATITRTYTVADGCGNTYEVQQTFTVQDVTDPVATAPPDTTVECEAEVPAAATSYAELVAQGGSASDNCTAAEALVVTHVDGPLSGGPCGGTITRTYTISDECQNAVEVQQTITVDDTTAPTFTLPEDITMNADAGGCTLTLSVAEIGQPTGLSDNCTPGGELSVSWARSDLAPNLDDPFNVGTTTITWRVEDACGNFATDPGLTVQTIEVLAFNELIVDVELRDVSEAALSRCITFEFWNCGTQAAQTVRQVVDFSNGLATGVSVLAPCGAYDCLRARDGVHTLWRTDADSFNIAGRQYVADFTGAGLEDDGLIGGNLMDDGPPYAPPQFIDVLDYAAFVNRWATAYGTGDTDCTVAQPHADISGDGTVETGDFTFIQTYFAFVDDAACCGLLGGGQGPRLAITVEELIERGLADLAIADLNDDGWVNEADVLAFANGQRPGGSRPVRASDVDAAGQHSAPPGAPAPAPPRGP